MNVTRRTIVIGAGQAGLAMSRASPSGPRPRRARARPGGRALALRALGLASPPDPELDEPPAGLASTTAPTRTAT